MKNLFKMTVLAFTACIFTLASCDSKPVESVENATEETVDAAGAELDSAMTPAAGDTAVVLDEPTKDGLADSMDTK